MTNVHIYDENREYKNCCCWNISTHIGKWTWNEWKEEKGSIDRRCIDTCYYPCCWWALLTVVYLEKEMVQWSTALWTNTGRRADEIVMKRVMLNIHYVDTLCFSRHADVSLAVHAYQTMSELTTEPVSHVPLAKLNAKKLVDMYSALLLNFL